MSSFTPGLVNQQRDWRSLQTFLYSPSVDVCSFENSYRAVQIRRLLKRGTAQCGQDRTIVKVDLAGMQ